MPSKLHEYAVSVLRSKISELKTHGFKQSLKTLSGYLPDEAYFIHIIPDAYFFRENTDPEYKYYRTTVVIYEVEVGNPIDDDKMQRILNTWDALDACGIPMELKTVDKFGRITATITDAELGNMYWNSDQFGVIKGNRLPAPA